ncbi:MAG: DUF4129 domain-containing protein, partial [Gammaproteobacteria bacterium]|nr:DUF4129 domain-containing protein [Gammaproteobacteria bacterium]
ANEGPAQFAQRVVNKRPDLSGAVNTITDLYVQLRYSNDADAVDRKSKSDTLSRLKQLTKQFKPSRMPSPA